MKKYIKLIVFIIVIINLFIVLASAHPGRTDENGGHWDRETGTYHFHTGEYKGRNSSGNSSQSQYEPFTPPYDPPTENPFTRTYVDESFINLIGYSLLLIPIIIYCAKSSPSYKLKKYERFLNKFLELKKEPISNLKTYCNSYEKLLKIRCKCNSRKEQTLLYCYLFSKADKHKEKLKELNIRYKYSMTAEPYQKKSINKEGAIL